MSTAAHHAPAVCSPVLLVVTGGRVSQTAITCAAELAAGGPVTVIGVGPTIQAGMGDGDDSPHAGMPAGAWGDGPPTREVPGGRPPGTSTEDVRRAVALTMSVLENTGVTALGHIAVTGPPARAVARTARARRARAVVLDQADGLAPELRRSVYGSGIVVVAATERDGRAVVHRDRLAR